MHRGSATCSGFDDALSSNLRLRRAATQLRGGAGDAAGSYSRKKAKGSRDTKYIVVTGGVLSGIGKGVTASSIGVLVKMMGMRPTAIKIDPYW